MTSESSLMEECGGLELGDNWVRFGDRWSSVQLVAGSLGITELNRKLQQD